MKSSAQLYAELNEVLKEIKEYEEAKEQLNSNVETFIEKCNGAASSAKSIQRYCLSSNDTNLKESANSGGCVSQLVEGINEVIEGVQSGLSAANSGMDGEIALLRTKANALRQAAAEAAAREARARAVAAAARRKNEGPKTRASI